MSWLEYGHVGTGDSKADDKIDWRMFNPCGLVDDQNLGIRSWKQGLRIRVYKMNFQFLFDRKMEDIFRLPTEHKAVS